MRAASRPEGEDTPERASMRPPLAWPGGRSPIFPPDVLVAQAAEKGLSPEPMRDYLNNFRYGCPPHGGFGLGLGRLLMTLLGLDSIRDAMFLFRGPNRLTP